MIIGKYDTDDLTDGQVHVFYKLYNNPVSKNNLLSLDFLSYSVSKNFRCREFKNYKNDCDYLLNIKKEILNKYGINLEKLYI